MRILRQSRNVGADSNLYLFCTQEPPEIIEKAAEERMYRQRPYLRDQSLGARAFYPEQRTSYADESAGDYRQRFREILNSRRAERRRPESNGFDATLEE
jgi:hypothetical protein